MSRRRRSSVPPTFVEPRRPSSTCTACRLHRARLSDEQRARYVPPLGVMFRIRLRTGGTLAVCPRCWKGAVDENGAPASLVEIGVTKQREAIQLVYDL